MNPVYLNRAQRGDSRAMRTLTISLHPKLKRMAAYYARQCRMDADDLAQEAWLGVLEALPRLDITIGNPEQSLLKYARWRLLDSLRRSLLHDGKADAINESVEIGVYKDPMERIQVEEFLADLSPLRRNITVYLIAGFTWREIGDKLGCTSANVAYHVRNIGARYHLFHDI